MEWVKRFGEGRLAYNDAGTGFGRLGIDAVALGVLSAIAPASGPSSPSGAPR
jgi:hypothetical protein